VRLLGNLTLLGAVAFPTAGPSAQGLADVAKRTVARPQQVAAKKYTNDDVKVATGESSPAALPAPAAPAAPPAGIPHAEEPPTGLSTPAGPKSSGAAAQDEADPKQPAAHVVARIAALRDQIEARQEQLRALETSSPAAQGAPVEKLRNTIANLQKELAVLETGRLPGGLRSNAP
jgi:hypothetical protein